MDNILGLFEKLESQSLAVQPSRCVVVRNRNASCRRCAEACPTGAILVEGNDLAVAPERSVAAPALPCARRRRWNRRSPTTRAC